MEEKCYGARSISYMVTTRRIDAKGRIGIFVFHENQAMLKYLRKNKDNPREMLKR